MEVRQASLRVMALWRSDGLVAYAAQLLKSWPESLIEGDALKAGASQPGESSGYAFVVRERQPVQKIQARLLARRR
jgi:hypothetical protein